MYHILIVDEEEHLLWALEKNLFPERTDIEVLTATTGKEGLEILEREPVDLLISDIKMPGPIDGFQLILRAKEFAPDARVMIITAFGADRIQNFAERIGYTHYLEKPFTVGQLREAILEILDEKEGFQGVLSDLELTDIIQMLCLAKRTALLHLKHREERGKIVFERGELVHAEFASLSGPEAVYRMLALRQGDIFMQSDFENEQRTIELGWQDVLLEGVRQADEDGMEEEGPRAMAERSPRPAKEKVHTPFGVGVTDVSEAETVADPGSLGAEGSEAALFFSEAELDEMAMASEAAMIEETRIEETRIEESQFAEVSEGTDGEVFAAPALGGLSMRGGTLRLAAWSAALEKFCNECPGMQLTALIGLDPQAEKPILCHPLRLRFDKDEAATHAREIVERARRTVEALGARDVVDELQIIFGSRYVLARPVHGSPYWHVAIIDKEASLGIALVLMRQLEREFAAPVGPRS